MGVDSLWPLLAKAGRPTNPARLGGRRVAVDASIWLAPHLLASSNNVGPRTAHLNSLFRRLAKLLFFRVKPVFVFDGARPALKEAELRRRAVQRKTNDEREAQSRINRAAHRLLQARLAELPPSEAATMPALPPPPVIRKRRADPEPDVPEWEEATPTKVSDAKSGGKGEVEKAGDDESSEIEWLDAKPSGASSGGYLSAGKAANGKRARDEAGDAIEGEEAEEAVYIPSDEDSDERRERSAAASELAQERWAKLASSAPSDVSALQLSALLKRARPLPPPPPSAARPGAPVAPSELSGRLASDPNTVFHYTRTSSSASKDASLSRAASASDSAPAAASAPHTAPVSASMLADELLARQLAEGVGDEDSEAEEEGEGEGKKETNADDDDLQWEAVEPVGPATAAAAKSAAAAAKSALSDFIDLVAEDEATARDGAAGEEEENDWEAEAAAWEAWERAGRQIDNTEPSDAGGAATEAANTLSDSGAQPPPGDAEEAAQIQQAIALSLGAAAAPASPPTLAPGMAGVVGGAGYFTASTPTAAAAPSPSPSGSGSSASAPGSTPQHARAGATGSVWQEFMRDCHELLRLFGVPWLSAPAEAEAQCAWLNEAGLVDAVVSDDSDTLLFGERLLLIRHLFRRNVAPLAYASADVSATLGLTRTRLVDLALLLGSDYTAGIPGVGPVRALELLSAFPSLDAFARWAALPDAAAAADPRASPALLAMRSRIRLPPSFPDARVRDAYTHPLVDTTPTPFTWAAPDLPALRAFATRKLHWPPPLTDLILGPLEQTVTAPEVHQRTLDNFVIPTSRPAAPPSQRLKSAVERLVSPDKAAAAPVPAPAAAAAPKAAKKARKDKAKQKT